MYTTDVSQIQRVLPGYSETLIKDLIIDRRGNVEDSHMTAYGLHQAVNERDVFEVDALKGLVPARGPGRALPLVMKASDQAPTHAVIQAIWDKNVAASGAGNNILGGNGTFHVEEEVLEVPVVEATERGLSYYGATLLDAGEKVVFPKLYPIWTTSLGTHYVEQCLMTESRGGFYVEYHHDQPHFHMPLSPDADGFYILGKQVAAREYHFTGFKIPFGKAVYTSGGAIHCDAALTGEKWIVGYAPSDDFSTVNVRSDKGAMTVIKAKERKPRCTVL